MSTDHPSDRPPTDPEAVNGPTVLGLSLATRLLFIVGAPALGLVLGYYLPTVAAWALTLPWIPMKGPFRLIAAFDGVWAVVASLTAGGVLGLLVAHAAITESLKVTLSDGRIQADRDEKTRVIDRSEVAMVFLDGRNLVVLDRESRQFLREPHDSTADQVERAFRAHGYPWTERDPYVELYRRWVPDTPDLPPTVNAILAAREVALRKKVRLDVVELRDEVQKLGFVVRDEGPRQYWRQLVRS